jgi:hypothetical protein
MNRHKWRMIYVAYLRNEKFTEVVPFEYALLLIRQKVIQDTYDLMSVVCDDYHDRRKTIKVLAEIFDQKYIKGHINPFFL